MPFNKRFEFIEQLSSLRDLRKLRSLIEFDLQYSDCAAESAIYLSIIDLQYYMEAVNSKLLYDYKNAETYQEKRQYKDLAINSAIWALNESFNNNDLKKCFTAIHQLLSIFFVRFLSKIKS